MIVYTDKQGRLVQIECSQKYSGRDANALANIALEDSVLELLRKVPKSEFMTQPTRD